MKWFMRRDLLLQIYPAGVGEFQALMPTARDGKPLEFGLLKDLLDTCMSAPDGHQWVFLEAPELTRTSLEAVFTKAAQLGFLEPESMFVHVGPEEHPEGFCFLGAGAAS